MSAELLPDWLAPPVDGYTADDLDRIPDLPAHTELIDGSLVFVSPQREFHSVIMDVLVSGLRRSVLPRLQVRREMSVTLDARQRPEPDIIVVNATAGNETDRLAYVGNAVVLAIEVVSPESEIGDRDRKPQLYARAGIPNFWRVEEADGAAVVYTYDRDPATITYVPTGIHHDRLTL